MREIEEEDREWHEKKAAKARKSAAAESESQDRDAESQPTYAEAGDQTKPVKKVTAEDYLA